jgi:undecaprenyl-diphosphatase
MDFVVLLKAAVMGIVEGLTEFLPISSTGHLILAGALLGLDDEKGKVFDIAIQTGAIFAVILVYWQKISRTVLDLPTDITARRFAANVVIAFCLLWCWDYCLVSKSRCICSPLKWWPAHSFWVG